MAWLAALFYDDMTDRNLNNQLTDLLNKIKIIFSSIVTQSYWWEKVRDNVILEETFRLV